MIIERKLRRKREFKKDRLEYMNKKYNHIVDFLKKNFHDDCKVSYLVEHELIKLTSNLKEIIIVPQNSQVEFYKKNKKESDKGYTKWIFEGFKPINIFTEKIKNEIIS